MSNVICPNSIRYFTLAFFTKTIISLAFFLLYITRLISVDAYLHLEILCLFFVLLFPTFKALEHLLKNVSFRPHGRKKSILLVILYTLVTFTFLFTNISFLPIFDRLLLFSCVFIILDELFYIQSNSNRLIIHCFLLGLFIVSYIIFWLYSELLYNSLQINYGLFEFPSGKPIVFLKSLSHNSFLFSLKNGLLFQRAVLYLTLPLFFTITLLSMRIRAKKKKKIFYSLFFMSLFSYLLLLVLNRSFSILNEKTICSRAQGTYSHYSCKLEEIPRVGRNNELCLFLENTLRLNLSTSKSESELLSTDLLTSIAFFLETSNKDIRGNNYPTFVFSDEEEIFLSLGKICMKKLLVSASNMDLIDFKQYFYYWDVVYFYFCRNYRMGRKLELFLYKLITEKIHLLNLLCNNTILDNNKRLVLSQWKEEFQTKLEELSLFLVLRNSYGIYCLKNILIKEGGPVLDDNNYGQGMTIGKSEFLFLCFRTLLEYDCYQIMRDNFNSLEQGMFLPPYYSPLFPNAEGKAIRDFLRNMSILTDRIPIC